MIHATHTTRQTSVHNPSASDEPSGCLRAIAAAGVLVAGVAETESRAAIFVGLRAIGQARVDGTLQSTADRQAHASHNRTGHRFRTGLQLVHARGVAAAGSITSVEGASATSNAPPMAPSPSIPCRHPGREFGRVHVRVGQRPPPRHQATHPTTLAQPVRKLRFFIDSSYDYEIIINALSAGAVAIPPRSRQAPQ